MPVEQDADDYPGLVYTGLTGPQGFPSVYFTPADKMNLLTLSRYSLGGDEATRAWPSGMIFVEHVLFTKTSASLPESSKGLSICCLLVLKTSLGAGGGEEMHDIFSSTIQSQMLLYKPDGLLSCTDFPKSQLEHGPQTPEYQLY